MRRGLWKYRLTAMMAAVMMLAGCGAGSGSSTVSTASPVATGASTAQEQDKEQQHRIVSTTVAITQLMDLLEIDLIGIPNSIKTLPERYKDVTKIGNPMSPDMERVKSLQPTDVLSVTTLQYELEPVFDNVGISGHFLDLTSLESMMTEITKLGQTYNRGEQAAKLVKEYELQLERIRQAAEGKKKPTVLILLGVPGSYLVATEHSYIGDLVRLLGGVNIAQGESVEFLASNTEHLQQANPDVILRAAHGMPEEVVKMFDEEFKKNDIWKHFNAVQNGHVYDLEERLFGTTGNMLVGEALEALLPMLYP